MSVRDATLRLAYERLCRSFLKKLKDPMAAQEACLRGVLKRCKNTVYGKEHGFSEIRSVEDFQRRVPVTTYESMKPYIIRCKTGEQNILFPDKILYFMATAGTTGDSKYYPLGEYRVRGSAHKTARRGLFYIVHGNHYDLLDGVTLNIHAAPLTGEKFGPYDVAYVSGALAAASSSLLEGVSGLESEESGLVVPPPKVNAISDWGKKIYLTARYAVAADVRMSAGISAVIISLLQKISTQFYDQLIADPELDNETKAKLRRVSKDGVINLRELWPNFTIFGNSGLSITPFRRIIRDLLGDVEIWDFYGATEGTVGVQIYPDGGIVLAVDRGFFEFQPDREGAEPILISDVKINTPYRILITNHAGFFRYVLGDIITFTSLDPPEFGEITRMKTLVNLIGERLREELLLRAIEHACEKWGTSFVDFALLPEITTDITRYQLFVEFTQVPSDLEEFASDIDSHLRSLDRYYEESRQGDMLSLPLVVPVRLGGFEAMLREMGKDLGVSKVPRLLTPELSRLIPILKSYTS